MKKNYFQKAQEGTQKYINRLNRQQIEPTQDAVFWAYKRGHYEVQLPFEMRAEVREHFSAMGFTVHKSEPFNLKVKGGEITRMGTKLSWYPKQS